MLGSVAFGVILLNVVMDVLILGVVEPVLEPMGNTADYFELIHGKKHEESNAHD